MALFVDHFWGTGPTPASDYVAFDVMRNRLRDGKSILDELTTYNTKRVEIEMEYGRAMVKLGRSLAYKEEIGTLRTSLDTLMVETEHIGFEHQKLGRCLQVDIGDSLKMFRRQQQEARRKTEEIIRRFQKNRNAAFDKTMKSKKAYYGKCKEAELIDEKLKRNQSDQDKLLNKAAKAKLAIKQHDATYKESVQQLEKSRIAWEEEMVRCCNQFQDLEEMRIGYLRETLWKFSNVCSTTCVEDDKLIEKIRFSLESCDIESDVDEFINSMSTGSERPLPIPYENYYGKTDVDVLDISHSVSSNDGNTYTENFPTDTEVSVQMIRPNVRYHTDSDNPEGERPLPMCPKSDDASNISTPDANEEHSLEEPEVEPREIIRKVRALFSYQAQCVEELSFHEHDEISVVGQEDEHWWEGFLPTGETGMFPAAWTTLAYTEKNANTQG